MKRSWRHRTGLGLTAVAALVGGVLVAPSPAQAAVGNCQLARDVAKTYYAVSCNGGGINWYRAWAVCQNHNGYQETVHGRVEWVPILGGYGSWSIARCRSGWTWINAWNEHS